MSCLLEVRGIVKRFGGLTALNQVSFGVREGTVTGLIGPNGSGKTTMMNTIAGVLAPDQGEVLFGGQPIHGLPPHAIATHGLARTFQTLRIFGRMTVLENVLVGQHVKLRTGLWPSIFRSRNFRREEQEALRQALELLEFTGISHLKDVSARDLSYGDQRRMEVARALALQPKLLLLDEPAAGMNDTEREGMTDLIRRIRGKGITVLVVEHSMKLIMDLCDEIVVLDHGQKLAQGTAREIKSDPKVIEAYLGRDEELLPDVKGGAVHAGTA